MARSINTNITTRDPVLNLALESSRLSQIAEHHERMGHKLTGTPFGDVNLCYLEAERDDFRDRVDMIEDYSTTLKARTPAGALAHLRILNKQLGLPPAEGGGEYQKRQYDATLRRLVHSIDGVLAALVPAELRGSIPHANPHQDPWVSHERRWADVRRLEVREKAAAMTS